jgi:hypothetical protein
MVTAPLRMIKAPMPVMMRTSVRTAAETIVSNDGGRERVKGEASSRWRPFYLYDFGFFRFCAYFRSVAGHVRCSTENSREEKEKKIEKEVLK